jgi:autotransporter-associated beta strand protein
LRINTTNDFTGGTALSGGTLQLGSDQALGAGPLTMNVGGVTFSALSSDGLSARTITNAVTLSVGGTQVFGDAVNSGPLTIASKINLSSGNRTVTTASPTVWSGGSQNGQINNKKGDSSLTLKGTNDWLLGTATFLLQQGTVVLDGGSLTIPNEIRLDGNVAAGITTLVLTNGAVITNTAAGGDFYVGYNSPLYASVTNWVDFAGMMRYPNNPGNTANNRLFLARGANSSVGTRSVVNLLAGGDVEFSQVIKSGTFLGTPGYGEFNFDGGILRALADNANFVVGFDVCAIRSGGANIDSRSFTISIPQNLDAGSPSGGLTKTGNGTLFLNGTNTYTGDTLASAGMLGGSGSVVGTVNCSGGTFAPGGNTSIKTFTIGGTLWATNQTVFTLNKTVSPSNSMAVVTGTINAGGTLTVTNIGTGGGAALAAGDSFQLFNKAVTGMFATLNLPTKPANTAWTNKLAIDGSIALYATQPAPANITYSVIGGDLVLTWPNGAGWTLEVQTNSLSTGLGTNWVLLPGATSPFTNAVDSANGSVFYRLKY